MSASREKKQRQGAGPSEKAIQAQQQQAVQKRKAITYTVIGAVIVVLIAALLIWNTGFFQARATAANVGGDKLTTAELSYYYYGARMTTVQYAAYGLNSFDTSLADDEQMYNADDGETYRDYFMETALASAQEQLSLYHEALDRGYTEADVKDALDAQIASIKSSAVTYGYTSYAAYLQAMYGPYMTSSVYEKIISRLLLASRAYTDKLEELETGYAEADLDAYYNEDDHADTLDTFEYSSLYFTPAEVPTKDDDGNDIDEDTVNTQKELALAEAKANADEALEALQDGGSVSSLASKYDLAETAYTDHGTAVGKGNVTYAFQDELAALKEGESTLVENGTSGYYVITLHSRKLVQDPTKDVRHILAIAEHTTDEDGKLVAPTDEAWAAAKEKIDAIQAEWEAGDRTEDSFANLANEKSDDGDGTTGGLYTKIDVNDLYVSEFKDWIFTDGRAVGDTGIVQHSADEGATSGYYGYHFMYQVGDNEPLWMRTSRENLAQQDYADWLSELKENYQTSLTDGANYLGK